MKRNYKFNRDAHMASTSYRISKKILSMPTWMLYGIAISMSIIQGLLMTKLSEVMKAVTDGTMELVSVLTIYIIANIGVSITSFIMANAGKAFKLKEVNRVFLREYERVYNSRTQDISAVGPAKIESTVNQMAVYDAEKKSLYTSIVTTIVPFAVTIYNVGRLNLYAALAVIAIMGIAAFMSLNGDKMFHFNETASQMKGEMHSISVNNFIIVRMMKYMGAHQYAIDRQKMCQDDASPSCHNEARQIYNGFMNLLYNLPILIALAVAVAANDLGLAIFIAINEWTISSMIGNITSITDLMSEIHGFEKVLEPLKGDDTPIDEKPAMPEELLVKDVEFYYPSDSQKLTPFRIPEFRIKKGDRYRFSAASGAGKSSFFKYFAGEMRANKDFNIRTFYIHQRSELVYGTVRDNITLGNTWVPDPVIEQLIDEVRLDKWFKTLPNGLDTVIGKEIEPSGGEQSRISLLRLFIHLRNYGQNGSDPIKDEIIILDEVTSALDKRDVFIKEDELSTEESVIKVIDRETKGCTMFVISHEDANSKAFGFKNIIDHQMLVRINDDNSRELVHYEQ